MTALMMIRYYEISCFDVPFVMSCFGIIKERLSFYFMHCGQTFVILLISRFIGLVVIEPFYISNFNIFGVNFSPF